MHILWFSDISLLSGKNIFYTVHPTWCSCAISSTDQECVAVIQVCHHPCQQASTVHSGTLHVQYSNVFTYYSLESEDIFMAVTHVQSDPTTVVMDRFCDVTSCPFYNVFKTFSFNSCTVYIM